MRQATRVLAGVFVGLFLTVLAGGGHAAAQSGGQPAPAQAYPPPAQAYPPPPAQAYPPGYGAPPPGYPPPPGFAPYQAPYGNGAPPAAFMYEAQKKNELLALAIEFFIPGVGSIYADHVAGAMVTWGTFIAGVVLFVWWFGENANTNTNASGGSSGGTINGPDQLHDLWAVYLALGLVVGGRIYGLVDSYSSAKEFNQRLRARLGMPEWGSLGVVPIRTDRADTRGPSFTMRF
jgi:hypothetical protein